MFHLIHYIRGIPAQIDRVVILFDFFSAKYVEERPKTIPYPQF